MVAGSALAGSPGPGAREASRALRLRDFAGLQQTVGRQKKKKEKKMEKENMVLKSPSPTYWAELKWTHLQNTHTHTHSHIHTPGARRRRRRKKRSELQQPPRMARCAPAEMYKCSEPYETHGLSERLPRFPPSPPPSLPSLLAASSPRPPPRLGAARERNLPPPSLSHSPPHTPLSLPARPLPSSFPTHPPTHPLAGSRLSPAQPPAAARPSARLLQA